MTEKSGGPPTVDLDKAEPVLMLEDVHVRYRVRRESGRPRLREALTGGSSSPITVDALKGIDLVLHEGEALGVIGSNGSGKSTLLRTMAGMLRPWRGRVLGRERPVLLQVSAAFERALTGRRNVVLGGTALGMRRRDVIERFDDIVEFAELHDFIDLPLGAYSSGMAARLQFSVATMADPSILLIDEALAVGDRRFKLKSEDRMRRMLEGAGTVVLVSHSAGSIRRMCNRVLWVEDGKARMVGPTEDVMAAYENES